MPLALLLHLCDSLLPTGAFAHSDGLEAATADGAIASAGDLQAWMDAVLDVTLVRCDAMAVLLAWQASRERRLDVLAALDAELHALRPSSTARTASRAMGARLLKTWRTIHPELATEDGGALPESGARPTLPVAFGSICASSGIDARAAVEGFIYTRLAATVSAAMRLMTVGQNEAHALLARTLARVPAAVDAVEARVSEGGRPGAFAPGIDLAAMSHQYVRTRLFLS